MEENTQQVEPIVTETATTETIESVVEKVIEGESDVGETIAKSLLANDAKRISDKEKRRRRLANKVAREQRRIQRRQANGKGR